MSDSLTGQKFRVMALSAQANQAIDVERSYREQVGARAKSALTRGKVVALASVAGLTLAALLRRRARKDDDQGDRAPERHKRSLLAKVGVAVLALQRIRALVVPFARGMNWAAQREERVAERIPEPARAGE